MITDVVIEPVIDAVRKRYFEYFPDDFGEQEPVELSCKLIQKAKTNDIYKISLRTHCTLKNVFVKMRNNPQQPAEKRGNETEREFAILIDLWQKFLPYSEKFSISRPLDYLPEHFAFIMEECPGQEFSHYLGWGFPLFRHRNTSMLKNLEMCGEWLGLFHKLTCNRDITVNSTDRLFNILNESLHRCKNIGMEKKFADSLSSILKKNIMHYCNDNNIVSLHNNYNPRNIFICGNKVSVIDFEYLSYGISHEDLRFMLAVFELKPHDPRYSHKFARKMRESFLGGYSKFYSVDLEALNYFVALQMIYKLSMANRHVRTIYHKYVFWKDYKFISSWLKDWLSLETVSS